jgi:predicted ATPase
MDLLGFISRDDGPTSPGPQTNEPETSLHPDLLEPLARLIVRSAERSQVWLVTHSRAFAAALAEQGRIAPRTVIKRKRETWMEGLRLAGDFDARDD